VRRTLLVLLSASTLACASAKLAVHDVAAVAKAPTVRGLAVTAAATGAALLLDDEIARAARSNNTPALDSFAKNIETFGGGGSDKVIAGFLLYGVAANDSRARATAFDAIISSVIASKAITPALKEISGRTRPNGEGDASFPSNHATQAFALASVIGSHYPRLRWLAYGVAGGVGFARVYHDAHFTSDVIAGAAIGAFVGHAVAKANRSERAKWTIVPVAGGGQRGLLVMLTQ